MISQIFLLFILESWWEGNATIEDWFDEMVGQANIINRFGGIKMEDIRGIRVPCKLFFLKKRSISRKYLYYKLSFFRVFT